MYKIKGLHQDFILAILCIVNLLFMHYTIFMTCQMEFKSDLLSHFDNFCAVIFDVSIVFLLFYMITKKNWRKAWTGCYVVTLLWSFSNIVYSRFFNQYISLSSIAQSGSICDSLMIRCIIEKLNWTDSYFLLSVVLFILMMKRVVDTQRLHIVRNIILINLILITTEGFLFGCYCYKHHFFSYFPTEYAERYYKIKSTYWQPVMSYYRRGSIKMLNIGIYEHMQKNIELNKKQIAIIQKSIKESKKGMYGHMDSNKQKNVIFILVESYMSFVSDMVVNGREVTPFLNSLKRDSSTYYNGQMHANITVGESSDGQFTYLTGLLPLQSSITISKAEDCGLPGLPKQLQMPSRMIIPTIPSVWDQDIMCQQYGFDYLYSSYDYDNGHHAILNDEQIFELAKQQDEHTAEPFFSFILTMSMHQPYNQQIDPSFPVEDTKISHELACYLNACHYTDIQIASYFDYLKSSGLYDRSVIVIASDHHVHSTDFGQKLDIPFYLINEKNNDLWKGTCQQVDVYTTLLDIMGVNSNWCGLGQSLISPEYKVKKLKWNVSEWIIRSNYFDNGLRVRGLMI